MAITRHSELRVYYRAVELRTSVFRLSATWPRVERYSLVHQVRRSSRAVGANIAEGWAKRRYKRHFVSKLTDALAEVEETTVWLDVARECGYLREEDHVRLRGVSGAIIGGLILMMRRPDQWCGPSTLVAEPDLPYCAKERSSSHPLFLSETRNEWHPSSPD